MPQPFDKVILASNEDPAYIDFWPVVAWAYHIMFPWACVELGFLTMREPDDRLVRRMSEFGNVNLFQPKPGIPQKNQSKMLMHATAMLFPAYVCYVDGIDYLPVNAEWILGFVRQREPGKFLLVGSEVYAGNDRLPRGIMPSSHMTAEGRLFRKITDPKGKGWPGMLDGMDGIEDEGWMEEPAIAEIRLKREVDVEFQEIPRELNVAEETIDRSMWDEIDMAKLRRNEIKRIHSPRPYRDHAEFLAPVLEWLVEKHGPCPPPPECILSREFNLGEPRNVAPPRARRRRRVPS